MFAQGQFTNDANATPESIARKRALIAALMPRFGSAKYVGEGLGQLATGVMIGRQNKKLDGAEAAGRQSADELFGSLLGSGGSAEPGGFTVMGQPGVGDGGMPMVPPDPNSPHALGADTMAALGKPPIPTGNDAASIKAGLVARGLPDHVADGFVMNMMDESGLNPGINETNPTVPGSRGGFGLYQLTGPRRRAYEAYAAEKGVPFDDVDAQLDFLMMEMQGPEAAAASAIMSTKTPGEAGAAIVNEFLRPAEEHRASRAAEYLGGAPQGAAAPVGYNATTPQIPTPDLLAALSNPWLAPEQKAVLQSIYEQQVQAGDPMRQLELQKAQLELAQLQNPTEQPPADFTERMFTLDALGIDRQSEEGKYYIMTGELPEPPKPGYRPMTPEEGAKLGVNPAEYQVSPENKIEKIGGGGVTVNNNSGGGKFEEEFAKGDAATVETVYNSGLAAQRNIGRIDQLDAILSQNPTGFGASLAQIAGEWGIPSEGLDEIQTAQAIINSLVPEQRQPGSGPMSDADLALFKQSLPRIIGQPDGNKMLIDTMRGIAEYDAEGARIVQRMRLPEGDPNRLTRAQAFDALQNRVNPLSEIKGVAGEATPDADGWTTINGVKIRVKQ